MEMPLVKIQDKLYERPQVIVVTGRQIPMLRTMKKDQVYLEDLSMDIYCTAYVKKKTYFVIYGLMLDSV